MNMEFFEWKVEKAEGFDVFQHPTFENIKIFRSPFGNIEYENDDFPEKMPSFKLLYSPLLTQRAVEGVNKEDKYAIYSFKKTVSVDNLIMNKNSYFKNEDIDQAKESALRYIHEQEKGA